MAGSIYISTSLYNASRVGELAARLQAYGVNLTYDWTKHGKVDSEAELIACGLNEQRGIKDADVFLFITPARNGSHTELGLAIAYEKPIVMLQEDATQEQQPFYFLPGVQRFTREEDAIGHILQVIDSTNIMRQGGRTDERRHL